MEIENTSITDLSFDSSNARTHDEKNLSAIAASLKQFGQQKPIVIDEDSKVLAGNGTLSAAIRLGWTSIKTVRSKLRHGDAVAYAIADNRTGELAAWNDETLLQSLSELQANDGILLEAAGFDLDDLEEIIGGMSGEDSKDRDDQSHASDDEFSTNVESITEIGDVIILSDHELFCGDCLNLFENLEENSLDAIVTDPPYGLGYQNREWDCSVPGDEFSREALRVLKPGGHLISFGGARTIHRLTTSLEDSGFEVRNMIGWLNWQGFPKSLDASKAIDDSLGVKRRNKDKPATKDAKRFVGYGTGLKPCMEPCVLVRKPLEGTLAENLLKWGTGALNIDATRHEPGDTAWPGPSEDDGGVGRWPSNVFHYPKPSRGEKEAGCDDLQGMSGHDAVDRKRGSAGVNNPRAGAGRTAKHVKNYHPTIKPVSLMKTLLRLVVPERGTVCDPFAGSGTTFMAAEREGFKCVGSEINPAYCDIIRARVVGVIKAEDGI